MNLRTLQLKPRYNSGEGNLLHELWIPLLSNSILYKRGVGYFRSDHLSAATQGLIKFIEHGGKALIICGIEFTNDDISAIKNGYIKRGKLIEKKIVNEIKNIDLHSKNSLEILAWMIKENNLDIKVAVKKNGEPGIFHSKFGICYDLEDNIVAFEGSANETAGGLISNRESISLDVSWNDNHWIKTRVSSIEHDFDNLWKDNDNEYQIIEFPEAAKSEFLKIAPKDRPTIEPSERQSTSSINSNHVDTNKIHLRDYQKECISAWINANFVGIFEMATGTGKTFTSIACIREIRDRIDLKNLCVVIVCPYTHLLEQWYESISKFNYFGFKVYGDIKSWKKKLGDIIIELNSKIRNIVIILTTYNTFSSPDFIRLINKIESPLMLIADEVHSSGSLIRREGLSERYRYRIGLSATPSRYFDDVGTNIIFKYFGSTVYEFSLEKAIENGYLVPYEYYPYYVDLTDEEFKEYRKISRKMASHFSKKEDISPDDELFKLFAIQRQKIIVNSSQKINQFSSIINDIKDSLDHCLIYCSEKQIDVVQKILNKIPIISQRVTYKESVEERNKYFDYFDRGFYKVMVAINILDEGVDIPSTKMAILLSSSGNPKQYIQRRGRVLRPYPGKTKATIYDIFVLPSLKHEVDEITFKIERNIVQKELKRHEEMAKIALNKIDAFRSIKEIKNRFNLP